MAWLISSAVIRIGSPFDSARSNEGVKATTSQSDRKIADRSASLRARVQSAPVKPFASRAMALSSCLERAGVTIGSSVRSQLGPLIRSSKNSNMSARAASSGMGISISMSNLPGRRRAGSSRDGSDVVARIITVPGPCFRMFESASCLLLAMLASEPIPSKRASNVLAIAEPPPELPTAPRLGQMRCTSSTIKSVLVPLDARASARSKMRQSSRSALPTIEAYDWIAAQGTVSTKISLSPSM